MDSGAVASAGVRRRIRIDLDVEGLPECGGPVEAGLQTGADELDGGTALPDGAVRYTVDVSAALRADGSVRWSGTAVQGTSADRFVYVSFRSPGDGRDWIRRFKVRLPSRLTPSTTVLRARVRDVGVTRPVFEGEGWREQ